MIKDDLSFLILCPEINLRELVFTVNSIKQNFPGMDYFCCVGKNIKNTEEIEKVCKVIKAGNTITSLINAGVKNSRTNLCLTITAGHSVKNTVLKKYDTFFKKKTNILYSVKDRETMYFPDAVINGMLLSKEMLEEVGDFDDEKTLTNSKSIWAMKAIDKGYVFKGIVGIKF